MRTITEEQKKKLKEGKDATKEKVILKVDDFTISADPNCYILTTGRQVFYFADIVSCFIEMYNYSLKRNLMNQRVASVVEMVKTIESTRLWFETVLAPLFDKAKELGIKE